jgi:hypothetical protein
MPVAMDVRRRPETLAWLTILSAFSVFVFLCGGTLYGIRWYRQNATQSYDAKMESVTGGTIAAQTNGNPGWIVLETDVPLHENDSVKSDRTGEALLTLFDGSTIQLLPDSEVQFNQLKISAFAPKRNYITVQLKRGKAVVNVAKPAEASTEFYVNLPQGRAYLLDGSYSLVADDTTSLVKVRERGRALVTNAGKTVDAKERERVELTAAPPEAKPASVDLIKNGDFPDELNGWTTELDTFCSETSPSPAQITPASEDGVPSVHFLRSNAQGVPCEVMIHQDMNEDVSEYWTLKLSVEAKLEYQSLSGGGSLGSEYPLMVRVRYRTIGGAEKQEVRGFYYGTPVNSRTDNGIQLPEDSWQTYNYDLNFMTLPLRPRQILSVEIVASGHDYESYVRRVSLIGE